MSEKKKSSPGISDVDGKPRKQVSLADLVVPKRDKPKEQPVIKPKAQVVTMAPGIKTYKEPAEMPMTLKAYLQTTGLKFDQTAGFRVWVKSRSIGNKTSSQWTALWEEFQGREVVSRRR